MPPSIVLHRFDLKGGDNPTHGDTDDIQCAYGCLTVKTTTQSAAIQNELCVAREIFSDGPELGAVMSLMPHLPFLFLGLMAAAAGPILVMLSISCA